MYFQDALLLFHQYENWCVPPGICIEYTIDYLTILQDVQTRISKEIFITRIIIYWFRIIRDERKNIKLNNKHNHNKLLYSLQLNTTHRLSITLSICTVLAILRYDCDDYKK